MASEALLAYAVLVVTLLNNPAFERLNPSPNSPGLSFEDRLLSLSVVFVLTGSVVLVLAKLYFEARCPPRVRLHRTLRAYLDRYTNQTEEGLLARKQAMDAWDQDAETDPNGALSMGALIYLFFALFGVGVLLILGTFALITFA